MPTSVSTLWISALVSATSTATLASSDAVHVSVQRDVVLGTFDPAFASVTHDIQDFIGYNIAPWTWDWSSASLRSLLEPLTPMTLRCGGTWEDGIFWSPGPQTGRFPNLNPGMKAHELDASMWDPFAQMMTSMGGVDLVVGLGALWRQWGDCTVLADSVCPGDIPWDGSNAKAFIQHNRDNGFKIFGYELGNEPAVWNWTWGSPIVTPAQHAADYASLRSILAGGQERIVGPDTTWGPIGDELPDGGRNPVPGEGGPNNNYWNATLQNSPDLDIAAFHYYGIQPSLIRSWRDFINIARDRSVCTAVAAHAKDLASSPLAGKPLWLGEGGATYGGFGHDVGGHNWLRLFGGALSYLENLGCAASNGASVFARQQLSNFITGSSTAAHPSYTPQPAWWAAVLWKRLVGTTAWSTAVGAGTGGALGGDSQLVHAYAFDGKAEAATVVLLVNLDDDWNRTQAVQVEGCNAPTADVYVLSPAGPVDDGDDGDHSVLPNSQGIAVNGKEALVTADGKIPEALLQPRAVPCVNGAAEVQLQGLTGAFVVLKKIDEMPGAQEALV